MALRERAIRGVAWSILERWGAKLISLLIFVVLARLLAPGDFGLAAFAAAFTALCAILQDQGFGQALVQRRELEPEHVDTAFWFGIATGLGLFGLAQIVAGPIATLVGDARLAAVIRVSAVSFVLSGFSGTPQALLRRDLAFQRLALRTLIASLIGGAVGIAAAVAGAGVWALVAQTLTSGVVAVAVLWAATDWRPRRRFSRRHWRDLAGFGGGVVAIAILGYVSRRSDDVLIGTVLGATALGFYAVAYRILFIIIELLMTTVGSVAMPTFSRMEGDRDRVRRGFYAATRMLTFVAFPVFAALSIAAPDVVVWTFGAKWAPSGPVMRILALMGLLVSTHYFKMQVILAMGKPGLAVRLNAAWAVLNLAAFAIGIRWGITGVAVAAVITAYLNIPLAGAALRRLIGLDGWTYARQVGPAALATAIMAAAMLLVRLPLAEAPLSVRLFGQLGVGAITYVVAALVVARPLVNEALSYARTLKPARGPRGSTAPADEVVVAAGPEEFSDHA